MKPYYEYGGITIYHGDCRDVLPLISNVDLVLTDPPYGINYSSGKTGYHGGTALPGITGDQDTKLRDLVLSKLYGIPSIVFGTWRVKRPENCRALLVWEKGDHVGMGDLSLPWKPNTEEVYILGDGFSGHRGSSVLRYAAPVTWNSSTNGRFHPHQKPIPLIRDLLSKHSGKLILDPFMGSGTTLVAAKSLGRRAIGIEIEERYCEIAVKRLAQEMLFDDRCLDTIPTKPTEYRQIPAIGMETESYPDQQAPGGPAGNPLTELSRD